MSDANWLTLEIVNNLRQILAERLAHYRKIKGWTQYDLAAESGVSVNALRGYEQQKRWPDPEVIEAMAAALGCRPIDLLLAQNQRPEPTPEEALEVLKKFIDAQKGQKSP